MEHRNSSLSALSKYRHFALGDLAISRSVLTDTLADENIAQNLSPGSPKREFLAGFLR